MPDPIHDWEALGGSMAGDLLIRGTPEFEEAPKPFNARFHHVRPQAIARCATPDDVVEVLAFTRRHGLELATRSGGHCFAGRSSSRGIVIDVTPLQAISVEAGIADVGAGARLGEVYDALQEHGLAIPGGTCPSVGVAGLALGGGLGILGRRYGLTSDRLVGAQIVTADGRILECDEERHPELFWALRGAGAGNFGVVTSLRFRTVPAPDVANFHASWPFARAAAIVHAWQEWAPEGPDELAASLKVTTTPDLDRPPSVDVYGAFLGTESDALDLLDELATRAGADPATSWSAQMPFPETRWWWANIGASGAGTSAVGPPPDEHEHPWLGARSEFFRRSMPAGAISELLGALVGDRAAGESRELDFMPWGGAYNRVPVDASAFVHRAERFQLKHAAVLDPDASSAGQRQAAAAWVDRSWRSVHRWASGRVFQNFPEPRLGNWSEAYYGEHVDRLMTVKARYDPEGMFGIDRSSPFR